MPSMPFMGVLISWLMVARKVLLARLAASTSALRWASAAFSRSISCSFFFLSVTSSDMVST